MTLYFSLAYSIFSILLNLSNLCKPSTKKVLLLCLFVFPYKNFTLRSFLSTLAAW